MSDTMSLYKELANIMADYPEPGGQEKDPQFRGAERQRDRLRWIAELCASLYPGDFVEIGCKVGATTAILAEIAKDYGRRVLAVDPWQTGTPGCCGYEYQEFVEAIAPYSDVVDVCRASSLSQEAIDELRQREICFAYVDGLHAYRAALSDIESVSHTHGIIAVDDVFWMTALQWALVHGADKTWRVPITRRIPPMREGYLLPAGKVPIRIKASGVAEIVADALRSNKPLSVIRVGDGEAKLLEWPDFSTRRSPLFWSLKYWFGQTRFGGADLEEMARSLRLAVSNADVIGVPSEKQRSEKEYWRKVEWMLRMYNLVGENAVLSDANLHISMYNDGLLNKVLDAADGLTIISSRSIADMLGAPRRPKFIDRFGAENITQIRVPGEAQVDGTSDTPHWPDWYDYLKENLPALIGKSKHHLCLVGAGPLGKIYCSWVKNLGGVALDMGSIFDVWAGVDSRSYQKNL